MTVSTRRVALSTPLAPVCGQWTSNLEVTGFDTRDSRDGPFALILANSDSDQGCFDISNAIVGNEIPTPGHGVRRGLGRVNEGKGFLYQLDRTIRWYRISF